MVPVRGPVGSRHFFLAENMLVKNGRPSAPAGLPQSALFRACDSFLDPW